MNVYQLIHGIANASAGPSYTVGRLTEELSRIGDHASILTLGQKPAYWPYAADYWIDDGGMARRVGLSLALAKSIKAYSKEPAILHGHGIWRMTNLFPLLVNQKTAPCKMVICPEGTLSQWSMGYKQGIKLPFWHLLQKPAMQRCHAFHATAENELADIRRVGLRGPVMLIPNGIDIPVLDTALKREKHILFLSRINPVKGLYMLLEVWAELAGCFPDWILQVAGGLEGNYAQKIQNLVKERAIPRVSFLGEVLGHDKDRLLQKASVFILPSFTENFGIVVAEALAAGMPVITTTGTPWKGQLEGHACGWTVKPEHQALGAAINSALSCPPDVLKTMGLAGRDWMQQDYAWSKIAEKMHEGYEYLLHGDVRPDFVHLD